MYFSNKTDKMKIVELQTKIEELQKAAFSNQPKEDKSSLLIEQLKKENEDLRKQLDLLQETSSAKIESLLSELEQVKSSKAETHQDLQPSQVDVFDNQIEELLEEESEEEVVQEEDQKPNKRGRKKRS